MLIIHITFLSGQRFGFIGYYGEAISINMFKEQSLKKKMDPMFNALLYFFIRSSKGKPRERESGNVGVVSKPEYTRGQV